MAKLSPAWYARRKLIREIGLDGVAAEVNHRHERKRGRKLTRDERCHGPRMKRILLALHLCIGDDRRTRKTIGEIRKKALDIFVDKHDEPLSLSTVRRALLDLDESSIVRVERESGKANAFWIVWPTIKDLAFEQGVQLDLFAEEGEGDAQAAERGGPEIPSGRDSTERTGSHPGGRNVAAAECGRPGIPPGRRTSEDPGDAATQDARSVGGVSSRGGRGTPSTVGAVPLPHPSHQRGQPLPHPSHTPPTARDSSLLIRARAFLLPLPKDSLPSSSEKKMRKEGTEEISEKQKAERAAIGALIDRGVDCPESAVRAAVRNGWTWFQIDRLLGEWDAKRIGEVRAWGPGALSWALRNLAAGRPLNLTPREEYLRAERDQKLRRAREANAAAAEIASDRQAAESARAEELEIRYGSELDALTESELDALLLAASGGEPGRAKFARLLGPVALRMQLLRHLERFSSGEGAPAIGGDGGAKDPAAVPGEEV